MSEAVVRQCHLVKLFHLNSRNTFNFQGRARRSVLVVLFGVDGIAYVCSVLVHLV